MIANEILPFYVSRFFSTELTGLMIADGRAILSALKIKDGMDLRGGGFGSLGDQSND